jgi:hypothetical protein
VSRRARFKVYGRFDGAMSATIEIDRVSEVLEVRPYRRRRGKYILPLAVVAEMVIWRIVRKEAAEKLAAKKAKARRK